MVTIYDKYHGQGFEVLAFPSNQFGEQEPWSEEKIRSHVLKEFDARFPILGKVYVNGDKTHATYKFLKKCFPGDITWNFSSKFLIDHNGVCVRRFEKESWQDIEKEVVALLKQRQKDVPSTTTTTTSSLSSSSSTSSSSSSSTSSSPSSSNILSSTSSTSTSSL
eukprot:TRINITY_DN8112_c0_g1_i1.p1 TRINITY_DN8112_c0_g1~~TRINITY_DN8112_c0_g1_i1.p1  ORF type:complete len:164 (-),score=63.43 TRINITY_DN8112_c0_g1_i1:508-999(-)